MLAVVKTPHTEVRISGSVSNRLVEALLAEFGDDVKLTRESDDELLDVFQTDWYRKTKRRMTPGTYMRICRENRRLTQARLGQLLGGVLRQHVSNMETGIRPISKRTALRLSRIFDVSVEKFIAG